MLNGINISVPSDVFNIWAKVEGKAVPVLTYAPCHDGIQ
jgi:hypothetical protein